jgi:hypothetical protein
MWSCKSKIVPGIHIPFSSFFKELARASWLKGKAAHLYINRKKHQKKLNRG